MGSFLLIDQPIQVFWTSYDPLDLASGSLDPLGFTRGYLALADRFLPTFTTVTTVPRYVSMLCAGLKSVQAHYRHQSSTASSKIRQDRLRLLKSFERAWALACGLAAQDTAVGSKAILGLRGIQYVSRQLETLSGRHIKTGSFNLLSNQVRYGGIGIYSTFMEDCHLASMQNLTLRPLGEALANVFPQPPHDIPVHDEDAKLSIDALREWGKKAHIGGFTAKEGMRLADALSGGEESDHPDQVRWAVLRILKRLDAQPGYEEGQLLRKLHKESRNGTFESLKIPTASLTQLIAILQIVEPFEQFYQSAVFLFECIRGAVSDQMEVSLSTLADNEQIKDGRQAILNSARDLLNNLAQAHEINAIASSEVEAVLQGSGVLQLVHDVIRHANDASELLRLVVRRHTHVQSGKFDKGLPKAAWTRLDGNDSIRLTAQRHQLTKSHRPEHWKDVSRHPYRTHSAYSFIRASNIK